jgi:hypothetical protein
MIQKYPQGLNSPGEKEIMGSHLFLANIPEGWIFNSQGGICNALRFPRDGIKLWNDWRRLRCCSTAICRDWMEGKTSDWKFSLRQMQLQVARMDSW